MVHSGDAPVVDTPRQLHGYALVSEPGKHEGACKREDEAERACSKPRACRIGCGLLVASVAAVVVCGTLLAERQQPLPVGSEVFAEVETKAEVNHSHCSHVENDTELMFQTALDSSVASLPRLEDCCSACQTTLDCQAWTWAAVPNGTEGTGYCRLIKGSNLMRVTKPGHLSGAVGGRKVSARRNTTTALVRLFGLEPVHPIWHKLGGSTSEPLAARLKRSILAWFTPKAPPPRSPLEVMPAPSGFHPQLPRPGALVLPVFPGGLRGSGAQNQVPQDLGLVHPPTSMPQRMAPGCAAGGVVSLPRYNSNGILTRVKVLTFNLFWWNLMKQRHGNGGAPFRLIEDSGRLEPYDIMAFQECEDPAYVMRRSGLENSYSTFKGLGTHTTAICMVFRTAAWSLLSQGSAYVAEDSHRQYYGKRAVQWMRLMHHSTGKVVFFMNHHGPLPVNSGGACGGRITARRILGLVAEHALEGDAIILVGDFNANQKSETLPYLEKYLHKAYSGRVDGGIDNIFTNLGGFTSVINTANLGGGGSDHDALSVVLQLAGTAVPTTSTPRPLVHHWWDIIASIFRR